MKKRISATNRREEKIWELLPKASHDDSGSHAASVVGMN